MKNRNYLLIALAILAMSSSIFAQATKPAPTLTSVLDKSLGGMEGEFVPAAEAMPEEKYGYRPAEGKFKNERPEFGPAEVRTFGEQVKHVACANFGFAAELDGK